MLIGGNIVLKKSLPVRLLALTLSLVLFFSASFSAAAAGKSCSCSLAPVIEVPGVGQTPLYLDRGTENEKQLFAPETDVVLGLVAELLPGLASFALKRDRNAFAAAVMNAAMKQFGAFQMDENGDPSTERVSFYPSLEPSAAHSREVKYKFEYDSRLDPLTIAEELNEYIEKVKTATGHDKVNIICASMGTTIVTSYIYKYGASNLDGIIFECAAFKGIGAIGELFCGRLSIDEAALSGFAAPYLPEGIFSDFLNLLMRILYDTRVLGLLGGFLQNGVLDNLLEPLLEEIYPFFGMMPGIWAFIPDEYYLDVKKTSGVFKNANPAFEKRVDEYHYSVQNQAEELLKSAVEKDGARVMILSASGLWGMPVSSLASWDSDSLIETVYSSMGAACAPVNGQLGTNYSQKNDCCGKNHVSPNNRIDASSCAFPEHTWFIGNMPHTQTNDGVQDFYFWFLSYNGYPDVFTNSAYPQFLMRNTLQNSIEPMIKTSSPVAANTFETYFYLSLPIIIKTLQAIRLAVSS